MVASPKRQALLLKPPHALPKSSRLLRCRLLPDFYDSLRNKYCYNSYSYLTVITASDTGAAPLKARHDLTQFRRWQHVHHVADANAHIAGHCFPAGIVNNTQQHRPVHHQHVWIDASLYSHNNNISNSANSSIINNNNTTTTQAATTPRHQGLPPLSPSAQQMHPRPRPDALPGLRGGWA